MTIKRRDLRLPDQLRPVTFEPGIAPHAQGSVLVAFGNTRVICAATVEENVPRWMKEQKVSGGWVTAEYSMLPYSTEGRKARDISRGKMDGRSVEIQRLIGRSLRAALDLEKLGPRTLWIDCDVLQADGGTRTASITGACVAVQMACQNLIRNELIEATPVVRAVAAVSAGVVGGVPMLDLDYAEDRMATVDFNLVMTGDLQFVELQGSGEEATFSQEELDAILGLGRKGVRELLQAQEKAVADAAD